MEGKDEFEGRVVLVEREEGVGVGECKSERSGCVWGEEERCVESGTTGWVGIG